jgi:transposase InsO family protein
MGLARSTFYDSPAPTPSGDLLGRIGAICDEFECYGYRRVGAALRHQGVVVNSKKLRRPMREHDLQPKRRRRYVVMTDSDHGRRHRVPAGAAAAEHVQRCDLSGGGKGLAVGGKHSTDEADVAGAGGDGRADGDGFEVVDVEGRGAGCDVG